MTAAANRRGIESSAPGLIRLSCARAEPIGVLVGDVDHFKRVNDTYGHPVGDDVLQAVVDAIRSCVRTEDLVARLGGEEFAVLTVLPPDRLTALAERVRAAVADQCSPWDVTVSLGVVWADACEPIAEQDLNRIWALIDQADELMYEAKQAGRNRVHALPVPQR